MSPAFQVEVLEPSGKLLLKYFSDELARTLQPSNNGKDPETTNVRLLTSEEMLWGRVGLLQYLVSENNQLHENAIDWDDDDENEVEQQLAL